MKTGEQIIRIAKVFFAVLVIVGIVAGVGVIIAGSVASDGEPGMVLLSILGGAAVVALGIFNAWIIRLFVTGFGELVENVDAIRENVAPKESYSPISAEQTAAGSVPSPAQITPNPPPEKSPAQITPNPPPEKEYKIEKPTEKPADPIMPIPVSAGKVRCPYCDEVQRNNRYVCQKCGVKFLHE